MISILLFLSDTRLAFYNTAPSPSGPSGIHCDLKPDADKARVTESGSDSPDFYLLLSSTIPLPNEFH